MITNDSNLLKEYFFPRITLQNGNEFIELFQYLQSIQRIPMNITYFQSLQKSKNIEIKTEFGPKHILQKTYILKKTYIHFTINSMKCKVNVYDFEGINRTFIDTLTNIIQYVFSLSPNTTIKELIVNIYLLDEKKQITKNMTELGKEEVNSGSCKRSNPTIITIYRTEELQKVLIHELIHAFEYDNYEDTEQIIQFYQKKYNLSSPTINTNEAYTEIWANILNCYLISQKIGRNQYNLFLVLLALEKEFANFQAHKVIYLTRLNEKTIDINKHTNVLSYYIIRSEVYQRLNLFVKFCKNHNENYIKLREKEKWFTFLKKNKKIVKNNRRFNNIKKNDYLFTTMRMSLNEFDI